MSGNARHNQPSQTRNEVAPKRGNIRERVVKGAAAIALVATGLTLCALRPWQNKGATPAQARVAIAGHPFDNPRIQSVVDTHKVVKGHDTLDITLKLPTDPTAAADMKQYAKSNAVVWFPPDVTSYTVAKDPKSRNYSIVGPGFAQSSFPVVPGGEALTVKDGIAKVKEHPNVNDPVGTEVALYATREATTSSGKYLTITVGQQYLVTLEKTPEGWMLMPEQPRMPDQIDTTTSP